MDWFEYVNKIIVVIGIPTIVGLAITVGKKLEKLEAIENDLKENIRPDLQSIRERFAIVEDRVETLWKDDLAPAHSPRQLNVNGSRILEESGIKKIIDEKREKLLLLVKAKGKASAYDTEKYIEEIVSELPVHCPDIIEQLKDGAFKSGSDINAVLFVGSIYLRNQIFHELGFTLTDLDKPKV